MRKLSTSMAKVSSGIVGMAVLFAALVATNIILTNLRVRLDLTSEKLYTLSDGTRRVLAKLDQPVVLKLYFNSSLPEVPLFIKTHAKLVEDLLAEYRLASRGKLIVEKHDPKPDSDAEDWAQRYGIQGRQIGGMLGPVMYFGLAAVAGDSEAVLPFLDPKGEEMLEYDITRLIYRVTHAEKPVVGVMSSLPVLGERVPPYMMPGARPPPMWVAFRELKDDYTLREVSTTAEEIDKEIKTLVVVHPKDLSDKTRYALDQFVLRGGRLIAFLDSMCVADRESSGNQMMFMGAKAASNLEGLLAAWGVRYEPGKVVADLRAASQVRTGDDRVEENAAWLSLSAPHKGDDMFINRTDILTAQLGRLMLPFAGAFYDETKGDVTVTPLIYTSESVGLVDSMSAFFGASSIRQEFKKEGKRLTLAMRLTGKFKTAFPDGPPGKDDSAKTNQVEEAASEQSLKEGSSTIILVADVDMLYDRFCVQELDFLGFKAYQPFNDNLNFLANAVEQMASSPDLIGIRSRGRMDRPFELVDDIERKAREEWLAREQYLEKQLEDTRKRLRELEAQKDKSQRFILTKEQRNALQQFRAEEMRIKMELKTVRKNLRREIERLGVLVKVINIGLMPLAVALCGISLGLYRRFKK